MRTIFGTGNILVWCTLLAACSPSSGDTDSELDAESDATQAAVQSDKSQPAAPGREDDIRHFLLQEYPEAGEISYALGWSDLDGDGSEEAIVYLAGPYFCGTGGCNLRVLTQAGPMWRSVGDVSVSRTPVRVLDTRSNGWKNLTVEISGGGAAPATVLLEFDGENYPDNASVAPAAEAGSAGTEVIAADPTFMTAQPLAPS